MCFCNISLIHLYFDIKEHLENKTKKHVCFNFMQSYFFICYFFICYDECSFRELWHLIKNALESIRKLNVSNVTKSKKWAFVYQLANTRAAKGQNLTSNYGETKEKQTGKTAIGFFSFYIVRANMVTVAYPIFKRVSHPGNDSPLLVHRHETVIANCNI